MKTEAGNVGEVSCAPAPSEVRKKHPRGKLEIDRGGDRRSDAILAQKFSGN